nr:probable G-protein coupled receptor Mth-like 4 [Procambarus clarkii]
MYIKCLKNTGGGWLLSLLAISLLRRAAGQSRQETEHRVRLPLCCPSGYISPTADTCIYNPIIPFRPQVIIGDSLVSVTNIEEEAEGTTLPCDHHDGEAGYEYVSLDSVRSTLIQKTNGTLTLLWLPQDAMLFEQSQNFCVMMTHEGSSPDEVQASYWAKVCPKDHAAQWESDKLACTKASCVRKCCPAGQHFRNQRICSPDDDSQDWAMPSPFSDLHVVYGLPNCKNLLLYPDFEYSLLRSGYMDVSEMLFSPQEYCIENNEDTQEQRVEQRALVCHKPRPECPWKQNVVIPTLMGVSCACLALTWVVYVLVPHLRNTNMGRCLLSFVSAMFVAFLTILINQVGRDSFSPAQCTLTALLSLVSILAMFFWLNVMSLHIFFHLRSPAKEDQQKMRTFLMYSLYAWGCPLLITLIGLTLDSLQADAIRLHFHLPNCWFKDEAGRWAYQYGIIVALVAINTFFFVSSVLLLRKRQRQRRETGYYQTISAWVFIKLFIIAGVLWITEVIAWQITNQCSILVVILDIINSLQGVYIFLVAVCLRKDLKVFHRGWPQLDAEAEEPLEKRNAGEVSELLDAPPRTA